MIEVLRVIVYPSMTVISLASFAMRMFFVWYIHHAEAPSVFFFWTVLEARKLTVLAVTNLFMFFAFGLISATLKDPTLTPILRPFIVSAWACCAPIYLYSVYLKYRELLERKRSNDLKIRMKATRAHWETAD